jgi:hypothetical protein
MNFVSISGQHFETQGFVLEFFRPPGNLRPAACAPQVVTPADCSASGL